MKSCNRKIFAFLIFIVFLFTNIFGFTKNVQALVDMNFINNGEILVGFKSMGNINKLDFTISDSYSVNEKLTITRDKSYRIIYSNNNFQLLANGTKIFESTEDLKLNAINGGSYISFIKEVYSREFMGNINFHKKDANYFIPINQVHMEDYIKGVLPFEMSNSFPKEALKAQAVAARTYAIANLGRYKAYGYDLTDDTSCQVYRGYVASASVCNAAADETKGQVLTYNEEPISALFSSSDGGYTERNDYVWNGTQYPYLQEVKDDFDTASRNWTVTYSADEIFAMVKKSKPEALKFDSIDIPSIKFYPSGRISALNVLYEDGTGKKSLSLSKELARTFFGLKSAMYKVAAKTDSTGKVSYVFTGNGYGHGVGMSQWGAYARANAGQNYRTILNFYYPNTVLKGLPQITYINIKNTVGSTPSEIFTGENYNLSIDSEFGSNALYKFWEGDRTTGAWTVLSDYSAASSISWKPKHDGTYRLLVYAKDQNSSSTFDSYKFIDIEVKNSTASLSNFSINSSNIYTGKSYSLSASGASGVSGNKVLYKFWEADRTTGVWTVLNDYSEASALSWIPKHDGTYRLLVYAKDEYSKNTYDSYKYIDVTVKNTVASITNLSINSSDLYAGKSYSISAAGTSGNKVLYKFWEADRTTGVWTVLSDYSETSALSWTPKHDGTYRLLVYAKDKYSKNTYDSYKYIDVTVKNTVASIINLSINSSDLYAGKSYSISAAGASGNKVLYKFWLGDRTTGTWTVLSDYSETSALSWTPKHDGTYRLLVYVKDKYSSSTCDSYKYIDVVVKNSAASLASLSINSNNLYAGKSYSISAAGASGNKVLYKFWEGDRTTGTWTVLSDYSETSALSWTPKHDGTYRLLVYAKDEYSKNTCDSYKYIDVVVKNSTTVLTDLNINSTNIALGESYNISASGTSGNKILYKFWEGDRTTGAWTVLSDYSEAAAVSWSPKHYGTYRLLVYGKDEYSSSTYDSYKYIDIDVKSPQIVSFKISQNGTEVSSYSMEQTYDLTAEVSPLKDILYRFYVYDMLTNKNTILHEYSTSNTVKWSPAADSTRYKLIVQIKNKNSISSYDNSGCTYIKPKSIGLAGRIIVIDPGHGGVDPGAISSAATGYIKESDLNLSLSYKIGDILKKLGAAVYYTSDYVAPIANTTSEAIKANLQARVNFADNLDADLFLSIHHNASEYASANGVATYYSSYRPELDSSGVYSSNDTYYDSTPCLQAAESKNLASLIVNSVSQLGFYNRGIHDQNLYVTRMAKTPSVLLEAGFMSNDAEVKKVSQDSCELSIAQKIEQVLQGFFK